MTKLASDPGPLKAYELVMAFAAQRGEAALRLAMHAALPQVLRPELLHLIRLNFLPEATSDLAIEADVLFAPFCEDIGNGYYCFAANARLQLLQGLDPAYRGESMPRSVQVARFMLDYLDHEERDVLTGSDRLRSDWVEVERWSALAFAEPSAAAGQLAAALARATANDDVAARVRVGGLASALATPLARFGDLLTYTEGVEAQQMGRAADAKRLFDTIPDREIEIAGVRLKSPRRVFVENITKEEPGVLAREPAEQPGVADEASGKYASIIGNSPSIRAVVEAAKRAATSNLSVLLFGETGTGKELLARSIHQWSHRSAMPFIVINCAAVPETLLESELFGHEPGAFTGALGQQKGKLEMADGGTVFLDEIDEMSLPLQTALLRVLQDREIYRVGGLKPVSVSIRIIAATDKDLQQAVRAGQFREDLYFRLKVEAMTLPPLRERSEDIPALAQSFLDRHMKNEKRPGLTLSAAALEALNHYPWPGNIRELNKVILRAVVLSPGDIIEPEMLGLPSLDEAGEVVKEEHQLRGEKEVQRKAKEEQKWAEQPALDRVAEETWRKAKEVAGRSTKREGVEYEDQRYDVFISYAQEDNEKPLGSASQYGWVTTLARNLNTGPNHYRKNLFIDHQLKPGDVFSDDLVTKVKNSTLLLLLLSQNYIDSTWCGKELDHFIRAHVNDPDKPADVFVVELFPFETFSNVPANIQNLRKRLIHAQFWYQPAVASAPLLAGDPSPQECSPESGRHYWATLHELRNAIDSRLRSLRRDKPSVSMTAKMARSLTGFQQQSAKFPLGTILLADTTDDLVAQRDAVKARLEPEGIVVLPEGDYVGLTPQEFEDEFTRDLSRSQLFVQLLSSTVGRTGKGFSAPLPQLQFDRAVEAKLPIMQWCERMPASNVITDPQHARLFNTALLRATNRTAFEQEIIARLQVMQRATKTEQAEIMASPAQAATKKLIFVDDVAGERAINERLRAILRGANCDVRGFPPQARLGIEGMDIAQVLKSCHAGITVFADLAKRDTVYNRLIFFLNQIAVSQLPIARWGIYVTPETAGYDHGLASDDLITINGEQQLAEFLRELER